MSTDNTTLQYNKLYIFLVIVTVVYLFWQISLCGAILSAETLEDSQRLTDLARLTVGMGTALFVFRTNYTRLKIPIALIIASLLGFGAMTAEDEIVDMFAEHTSGQERNEAKSVQLFNEAHIKGLVTFDNMPTSITDDVIKVKVFSKVLGFSVWKNQDLIKEIFGKRGHVLHAIYGQKLYDKVDMEYDTYVKKFKEHSAKLMEAKQELHSLNFAALAKDLNGQLVAYSACLDASCRQRIVERVQKYIQRNMPDLPFSVRLQDFCKISSGDTVYAMGRPVQGKQERICGVSEQELFSYATQQFDAKLDKAFHDVSVPKDILPKITSGTMLTLEAWRSIWKGHIEEKIAQQEEETFGKPERYGNGGSHAEEGKEYAVSVFLPPIALGFSITVCFLHIASLCSALFKRALPCYLGALSIYVLPAFFAIPIPLQGFAGMYAQWLVFWQSFLFPLGIFRNFIL